MPLFEYKCSACDARFEELVSSSQTTVTCPKCKSTDVEKLLSTFASSVGGSSASGPSCSSGGCGSGFS